MDIVRITAPNNSMVINGLELDDGTSWITLPMLRAAIGLTRSAASNLLKKYRDRLKLLPVERYTNCEPFIREHMGTLGLQRVHPKGVILRLSSALYIAQKARTEEAGDFSLHVSEYLEEQCLIERQSRQEAEARGAESLELQRRLDGVEAENRRINERLAHYDEIFKVAGSAAGKGLNAAKQAKRLVN